MRFGIELLFMAKGNTDMACPLWLFVLTRFLHANRYPLRSKTL
jgi:hypothetical protein